MCGITGLIYLNKDIVSPVILKKMTDAIAHRGPDGEGHNVSSIHALTLNLSWAYCALAGFD
jgi:asparagine synthetase B (glutamine-hydrolysing)